MKTLQESAISAINQRAGMLRQQHPALTKMSVVETIMANARVCSIHGCGKPIKGRGWCSAHVAKWRKYGDPLHVERRARASTPCVVEGCKSLGDSARKSMCGRHYKRQWRHGDPLKGAALRADRGAPLAWLIEHRGYQGDDCLKWPFADRGNGYGAATDDNGNLVGAHRLMCELAHGEPQTDGLLALHSCGKGHEGCVNPKHLKWGTVSENSRDMVDHGTALRGEVNGVSKLTEEDVRQIRTSYPSHTQAKLAEMYGVTQTTISSIVNRKGWAWLCE